MPLQAWSILGLGWGALSRGRDRWLVLPGIVRCSCSMTSCTYCRISNVVHDQVNTRYLHQAVPHGRSCLVINAVLSSCRKEVSLINLIRPDAFRNSNHPQELVDVITRISE